uniref:Uncharacterized protein n=1 Tax=Anguilla anguilla TaxID=7936 RepID=A0A0E9QX22_ANGAN
MWVLALSLALHLCVYRVGKGGEYTDCSRFQQSLKEDSAAGL